MFYGCTNLISIDFPNIDISKTRIVSKIFSGLENTLKYLSLENIKANNQNLSYMFNNLKQLISINLSNYNGSSVNTSMRYMFNNCENLKELNLSKLNFINSWNLENMFNGCISLTSLNLSGFNYSYTNIFSYMFNNCIKLKVLDLSNFHGSLFENSMDFMFNNCKNLEYIFLANLYLFNTTNVSYMFNGCISLKSILINNSISSSISDHSYMLNNCLSLQYVNFTHFRTSNKKNNKMKYMFNNCNNLTSIDFSNLDISFSQDYHKIFKGCDNINYLNLSYLKANYITNLTYLFSNMQKLISIDLSYFNPPLFDNTLEGMFFNCTNLKYINLSSYDFTKTFNITHMFRGCISLYTLDLSNFYNSEISDFSFLFNNCVKLKELSMGNFKGAIVRNRMDYMFNNCQSLTALNLMNLDLDKTYNISGFFSGCVSLVVLNIQNNGYADIEDYSYMFNNCFSIMIIKLITLANSRVANIMDYMFNNCTNLNRVDFSLGLSNFYSSGTKSMRYMFNNCSSLSDSGVLNMMFNGECDLSYMFNNCTSLFYFDINKKIYYSSPNNSKTTNLQYMFNNCINLVKVDCSDFNIELKANFKGIFSNCISLTNVNFNQFKLPNAIDLSYMFKNCTSLTTVELNSFDNLTQYNTIEGMFYNCYNLISVDLMQFDTSKTTNMKLLFYNCSKLTSLNLINLKTSSVIDMNGMFSNCHLLKSLNLSFFDTKSVIDMSSMFQNCSKIRILSLNNFDTSSVKKMDSMFKNCNDLISLFITNFQTESVVSMASMFENCFNMEILDISNFDTTLVTDMSSMFGNCIGMEYINLKDFSDTNLKEYNYMFGNTAGNLAFCFEEKKEYDSIVLNILNQKVCAINTCKTEWRDSQKIINSDGNKCVDKCLENEVLKYQFKAKCYDQCPNNTFLANEEEFKCEHLCSETSPFYSRFYAICIDKCSPYSFFNKQCSINNPLLSIQEMMTLQIENDLLNDFEFNSYILVQVYKNNENLITTTNKQIYQICSIKNGINLKTKIKFSEIENDLKDIYDLDDNALIVVFCTEMKINGSKIPIVEYNFYELNSAKKLDLFKASHLDLNIKYPAVIDANEEYKYNPYNNYYSDACIQATSDDGVDMIIDDRINEYINNNYSLCEKNCIYKGYDSNLNTSECLCKVKSVFKTITEVTAENDIFDLNFKRYKHKTNLYLLLCFKLLLKNNEIFGKVGSYIIISFFIIFIVIFFLFIKYGFDNLRILANTISNAKFKSLAYESKKLYLSQNINNFKQSSIVVSNEAILNKNFLHLRTLNNKQLKQLKFILKPTDFELNWFYSYDLALEKDKRKFFQYYFSLIKRKNIIIFCFFPNRDYNIRFIKAYMFFFYCLIFLTINTFFIDESIIHTIYIDHGKYNFKANITRIIYSLIISKTIITGVNFLALTDVDIIQIKLIKKKERIGFFYMWFLKKIFIKYIIFAFVNICIFVFSWIYLSCFCGVLKHSFIYLLINTIICIIAASLYPFIFCFIPTLLRYYALRDLAMDRERIFKISRIVQIL